MHRCRHVTGPSLRQTFRFMADLDVHPQACGETASDASISLPPAYRRREIAGLARFSSLPAPRKSLRSSLEREGKDAPARTDRISPPCGHERRRIPHRRSRCKHEGVRFWKSFLVRSAPGLLLLCCFAVPLATCQPQSQNEQGEDGGSCQAHPASHLPRPSFSAVVKPMEAMFVTRTTTYNPFWFALPTESANPGYLSNSARDTGIMNPSGSLLVHELLGGEHGCQARDPKTNLPPLVVDIGAHIGWFTMLAASYGCRVVAVEPQPHAHPFINASIVLNGWQGRVKTFHAACSDDSSVGMKMVNRHGWGNWDITEMVPESDPDPGDHVNVVTVDEIVDEDVLLIKIDAEGAEDLVLRSASNLLRRHKVASLLIESKEAGIAHRDAAKKNWFSQLLDQGYHSYEFYEEVGRSVWSWTLQDHLFPIQRVESYAGWPQDQQYEDHLFTLHPLPLPQGGAVSVQFPPFDHVFSEPSKMAVAIATYGFEIPRDGSLVVTLNEQVAAHVGEEGQGSKLGRHLQQITLVLPTMAPGEYRLVARLLGPDGAQVDMPGAEDAVHFRVDPNGPLLSAALRWHCERFIGPDRCR